MKKDTYGLLVFLFLMAAFTIAIILTNRGAAKYKELSINVFIDSTHITGDEGWGTLRNAVFLKKNLYVSGSSILIEGEPKFVEWRGGAPYIKFNNEPYVYTLNDLEFPYAIWKNPYSDTLYVEKEGEHLIFLMK